MQQTKNSSRPLFAWFVGFDSSWGKFSIVVSAYDYPGAVSAAFKASGKGSRLLYLKRSVKLN